MLSTWQISLSISINWHPKNSSVTLCVSPNLIHSGALSKTVFVSAQDLGALVSFYSY